MRVSDAGWFAFLMTAVVSSGAEGPVRVLIVTGGHDHHPAFYSVFDDERLAPNVDPHPLAFRGNFNKRYDVVVLYDMLPDFPDEKKRANLRAFVEAGKGVVVIHHGLCNYTDWPWWSEEVVGARYRNKPEGDVPASTYLHDETLKLTVKKAHPVTNGVGDFIIRDETYKGMWFSPKIDKLLTTDSPSSDGPVAWLGLHPKARVVAIQLGHGPEAHRNPNFQRLVRNAILYSAGRD